MAILIEFSEQDEQSLYFEIESEPKTLQRGAQLYSKGGQSLVKASENMSSAFKVIKPIVYSLKDKMAGLKDHLSEAEIEFGLKASLEAGFVVSKTSFDGHIRVKVKFKIDA